jgi:hypothetical protein
MASRNREAIRERVQILESSADREDLQSAGVALARSDDPQALERLGEFLARGDFLSRLDDVAEPQERVMHLRQVLAPLIEYPSPEVAALCLRLARAPAFGADDLRRPFLLEALARVRPMAAETVELFRRTNQEGYFASNAWLLAENGSARALDLLESMMADRSVPSARRVDCLHMAVVPHRIERPMLEMVAGLLRRDPEPEVVVGAVESVFDFRVEWFKTHAKSPPAWRSASDEALVFLLELGGQAKRHTGLPATVQESIDETGEIARALLARRAG